MALGYDPRKDYRLEYRNSPFENVNEHSHSSFDSVPLQFLLQNEIKSEKSSDSVYSYVTVDKLIEDDNPGQPERGSKRDAHTQVERENVLLQGQRTMPNSSSYPRSALHNFMSMNNREPVREANRLRPRSDFMNETRNFVPGVNNHFLRNENTMQTNLNKLIVSATSKTFENFVGTIPFTNGDSESALFEFLLAVYKIEKLCLFPIDALFMSAVGRTTGELNRSLISLISQHRSWLQISKALLDEFSTPLGSREVSRKYVHRTQNRNENLIEFVENIEDSFLVFYGYIDERMLIEYILTGLDPRVRFDVFRYNIPVSLVSLKDHLKQYLCVQRSMFTYDCIVKTKQKVEQLSELEKQTTFRDHRQGEPEGSDIAFSKPTFSKNYTGKRKSNFVANKGRVHKNTQSSAIQPVAVFTKATIFRRPVELAVDTCSTVSLINQDLINRLQQFVNIKIKSDSFQGSGIGNQLVQLNKCVYLPIFFGTKRVVVKMFIVDKLCSDILIGIDCLNRNLCSVDKQEKKLNSRTERFLFLFTLRKKTLSTTKILFLLCAFQAMEEGVSGWCRRRFWCRLKVRTTGPNLCGHPK